MIEKEKTSWRLTMRGHQVNDAELFEAKMTRLIAQPRKQQAEAQWLDKAIAENLEQLGFDTGE